MPKVSFRVRPVEGRQVLNPWTIGSHQQQRIGYERVIDGTVAPRGEPEPRVRYKLRDEHGEEVIGETTDHYLRRAILAGDLEYIETVFDHGDAKREKRTKDLDLVRVTAQHRKAREDAKSAAADAEAAAKKEFEAALAAAERGEEYAPAAQSTSNDAQSPATAPDEAPKA